MNGDDLSMDALALKAPWLVLKGFENAAKAGAPFYLWKLGGLVEI